MRLLVEVGEVCAEYQYYAFRNLNSKRLPLDEMWSWIYCKDKNRTLVALWESYGQRRAERAA